MSQSNIPQLSMAVTSAVMNLMNFFDEKIMIVRKQIRDPFEYAYFSKTQLSWVYIELSGHRMKSNRISHMRRIQQVTLQWNAYLRAPNQQCSF